MPSGKVFDLVEVKVKLGSIKGDVKKKHFSLIPRKDFSCIQLLAANVGLPGWADNMRTTGHGRSRFLVAGSVRLTSSRWQTCQPWFYRRLATKRGTIA
jgi:hypothetical protein